MAMHLLALPLELLEKIMLHVSPRALLSQVSVTCRHLREFIQSEAFWRRRYAAQMRAPLPLSGNLRRWQLGSVQNEFARAMTQWERSMHFRTLSAPTGSLDCVHMLFPSVHGCQGLVAAGSRNSSIYVWRRRKPGKKIGGRSMRSDTLSTLYGHKGWVWCLTSDPAHPELLCSGGWDKTIRIWDVTVGKEVASIDSQNHDCHHKGAVLALSFPQRSSLVTACHDKVVREFDLRVPISLAAEHRAHKRSVLALASSGDYVYTGGEDRMVCVWDRRSRGILQTLNFKGLVSSLHCESDMVSCAVQRTVYLYSCSNGSLTNHSSFLPEHATSHHSHKHCRAANPVLTCVYHNLGMVVTGCKDGSVAVHGPAPHHTHFEWLSQEAGSVTDVEYSHNTLALSGDCVHLFSLKPSFI